jgi:hypothetical protein
MVTVISRARRVEGRYHATSVLSPNSTASGRAARTSGHRLRRSATRPTSSGLILGDLRSVAPLHFFSDLREDVDARGLSLRATRPAQQRQANLRCAHARLASITAQGGEAALLGQRPTIRPSRVVAGAAAEPQRLPSLRAMRRKR